MNKYILTAILVFCANSAMAQSSDRWTIENSGRKAAEWAQDSHSRFMDQQQRFNEHLWNDTRQYQCETTRGRVCQ